MNPEEKSAPVKMSIFNHHRSDKYVGFDKRFKSKAELVNFAVGSLLDDYEKMEKMA
jgi:hypothetical protein